MVQVALSELTCLRLGTLGTKAGFALLQGAWEKGSGMVADAPAGAAVSASVVATSAAVLTSACTTVPTTLASLLLPAVPAAAPLLQSCRRLTTWPWTRPFISPRILLPRKIRSR